MHKSVTTLATSAVLAFAAIPAMAQQEPEEPRTTYAVNMIKFADGADDRWTEIMEDYVNPANAAAGQSPDVVHWIMANPAYDVIVVSEMEAGMASFDAHYNPHRAAFFAAMTEIVGGAAAMEALGEEMDGLVESQVTYFTHTHP